MFACSGLTPKSPRWENNTVTEDAHICTARAILHRVTDALAFATGGELAATPAMFWDSANDAVMNDGRYADAACR